MKVFYFTNEYPPYVYGGAGVHVEYLTREVSKLIDVEVRCFGDQIVLDPALKVWGFKSHPEMFLNSPAELKSPLDTIYRCLGFVSQKVDAQVVHCHTWYSHFGGILTKLAYGIPLVITVHSLEPLRPWKREQIGLGYDFSCWVERTALEMADAIISVSHETKEDILKLFKIDEKKISVIPNGIDTLEFVPKKNPEVLKKYCIDPNKPYVLFVGRITRQKGIIHLLKAVPFLDPEVQVVCCAGAPDTPQIAQEMREGIAHLHKTRQGIFWIQEKLDRDELISLYSHAYVFCCPSVYEPFGIINLEAMACEIPVVASQVGGIKEVVIPHKTGILVPYHAEDILGFEKKLADEINALIRQPDIAKAMGRQGRERANQYFSWSSVAQRVVNLYQELVKNK